MSFGKSNIQDLSRVYDLSHISQAVKVNEEGTHCKDTTAFAWELLLRWIIVSKNQGIWERSTLVYSLSASSFSIWRGQPNLLDTIAQETFKSQGNREDRVKPKWEKRNSSSRICKKVTWTDKEKEGTVKREEYWDVKRAKCIAIKTIAVQKHGQWEKNHLVRKETWGWLRL